MPATRIVNVNTRADAASLRDRIVRAGLHPEARLRAEAILRAANPHLDLDRLKPGSVVIVPQASELSAEEATVIGAPPVSTKEGLVAKLKELHEQHLAALEEAKAEREEAVALLKSRNLRNLEGRNEDLKKALTTVRERIAADEKEAALLSHELEEGLKRSLEEIEELFSGLR